MEHKGIQYTVIQTINPTSWKWRVQLPNGRTEMGNSFRRETAIKLAIYTIEKDMQRAKAAACLTRTNPHQPG